MHFGFSTFFFFGVAISDALDRLLSGGVRVIEFMHEVPHSNEIDSALIAKMKRLLDEGIQFSVHAPFLETNLGSYFEEVRRFSKERVKAAIEFASTIQADPVVVHPGYSLMKEKLQVLNEQARENFLKDLGEVVSFADGLGVRLALENGQMPFFFLYNVHEFPFYGDRVPHLGTTLDVGHAFIAKYQAREVDPEGAILEDVRQLGLERLFHVHLHNNRGGRDDHSFLSGTINMERILKGLHEAGYRGKVIIETPDVAEHGVQAVLEKLRAISPVPV
jgi:sugar phosphate isomerase/epimerase